MSHIFKYNSLGKMEIDGEIFDDFDEDSLTMDPMNDNSKQIVHQDFFNSFDDDIDDDELTVNSGN